MYQSFHIYFGLVANSSSLLQPETNLSFEVPSPVPLIRETEGGGHELESGAERGEESAGPSGTTGRRSRGRATERTDCRSYIPVKLMTEIVGPVSEIREPSQPLTRTHQRQHVQIYCYICEAFCLQVWFASR